MACYHKGNGRRFTHLFADSESDRSWAITLTPDEQEVKQRMLDRFRTQQFIFNTSPKDIETLRPEPTHDFTAAPSPGPLAYGTNDGGCEGALWRLLTLLNRQQFFRGMGGAYQNENAVRLLMWLTLRSVHFRRDHPSLPVPSERMLLRLSGFFLKQHRAAATRRTPMDDAASERPVMSAGCVPTPAHANTALRWPCDAHVPRVPGGCCTRGVIGDIPGAHPLGVIISRRVSNSESPPARGPPKGRSRGIAV